MSVCKQGPKGLTVAFLSFIKSSGLVIYSYLKDSAFATVKRDGKL